MSFSMKATNGGDFAPHPEGTTGAVCIRVVDLGTQDGGQFGPKRKVMITWESSELMSDGRPFLINKFYSHSFHEKAKLRQDLEAWRGKAFADGEAFDLSALIGKPCLLNILHNDRGYADVRSISPLPKGMTPTQATQDTVVFNLDAPDWDEFEKLSERLQERIAKSPEYARTKAGPSAAPPAAKPEPAVAVLSDDFDDELTF